MILDLNECVEKYQMKLAGVLHIGANIGGEYRLYCQMGISPMIFIEPLPHLYKELVKKTEGDERCITINKAIGNTAGPVTMYTEVGGNRGSSSVLKPKLHLSQYPHIDLSGKTTVDMVRIDDLNLPQVNFINIDIQGYELSALQGAARYLEKVDYVYSEVNRAELYENNTMVDELDSYLGGFGLERVHTHWAGGNWGDTLYIKR